MNLTWYNGKTPSARLNAETVDLLEQAAQAWKRGDVSTAWGIVGWACSAPWVEEVLDSLGLSATPDQQSILSNAERSHAIREKIQAHLATTPPRNYSVKQSVTTLRSFLTTFSDNESVDWLKESANNLLTRTDDVQQPLRVALLGEFSSGKSRLVNAILGKDILSTGIVPVTRSVTRIVYSEEIHVTVCYADGTETNVALDELKPFTDERQNKKGGSDVVEVILGHPTPLLKTVELWDTPGFNSNNQLHDEVASQLLLEADAVLWVIAAHQVGSRTESKLLQTVQRAQGKVVAVLNQTDRLNGDDEIQNQIQEVNKHFSDFVEEVVATSAKWIEEGHPGGNLKPLMHVIESIGSWSQEQRSKKMTHRISAVANQAIACRRIRESENKTLRVLEKKIKADVKEQRLSAFAIWKESQQHYTELIGVQWNNNNDRPLLRNKTDPWFESACLQRTPLALAYRALLRKDLSIEGYQGLLNCLRTLEETHLHVCETDPAAWKDDFLLSWRKGMDINVSAPSEYLFQQHQPVFGDAVAWLKKLCSITGTTCPTRWTGQLFTNRGKTSKTRSTKNVINKLYQLPAKKEINSWFNNLDSILLTIFQKSQPDWRIRLEPIIHSAPARQLQQFIDDEKEISELIDIHRPNVLKWINTEKETAAAKDTFSRESKELWNIHKQRISNIESKIENLISTIKGEKTDYRERIEKTGVPLKTNIINLRTNIIALGEEVTVQPETSLHGLIRQISKRTTAFSEDFSSDKWRDQIVSEGVFFYLMKRGIPVLLVVSVLLLCTQWWYILIPCWWVSCQLIVMCWLNLIKDHLIESISKTNVEIRYSRENKIRNHEHLMGLWNNLKSEKVVLDQKETAAKEQVETWRRQIAAKEATPPQPKQTTEWSNYQVLYHQLNKDQVAAESDKKEFMQKVRLLLDGAKT